MKVLEVINEGHKAVSVPSEQPAQHSSKQASRA
jgi:hypothetical protein